MRLNQVLDGIEVVETSTDFDSEMTVSGIADDTRRVEPGAVFVAYAGTAFDSHDEAARLAREGIVSLVIAERPVDAPHVVVKNGRKALALAWRNWFGKPDLAYDRKIAITGTNGKTTTSYLVESIFDRAGVKAVRLGTTNCSIAGRITDAATTTPSPRQFYELLAEGVRDGCTGLVAELSSHALHQHRVYGTKFTAGVFTNLSGDHLDYHGSMDEYFAAKSILFTPEYAEYAVVNIDHEHGRRIAAMTPLRTVTFSADRYADVMMEEVFYSVEGFRGHMIAYGEQTEINSSLVGRHNLENLMAAASAGIAAGISLQSVTFGVNRVKNVPGRLERFDGPNFKVFVDYAHTDDALENVLSALAPFKGNGRLVAVFGAGGDRDRTKRPRMAEAVEKHADVIIATSDNPRTEDPEQILDDVMKGFKHPENVTRITDRRTAIEHALTTAGEDDIILVAGKGHEDYQVIGTKKTHFDDREEVQTVLECM